MTENKSNVVLLSFSYLKLRIYVIHTYFTCTVDVTDAVPLLCLVKSCRATPKTSSLVFNSAHNVNQFVCVELNDELGGGVLLQSPRSLQLMHFVRHLQTVINYHNNPATLYPLPKITEHSVMYCARFAITNYDQIDYI